MKNLLAVFVGLAILIASVPRLDAGEIGVNVAFSDGEISIIPVSYTHLTLPTITE